MQRMHFESVEEARVHRACRWRVRGVGWSPPVSQYPDLRLGLQLQQYEFSDPAVRHQLRLRRLRGSACGLQVRIRSAINPT